MRILVTGSSGTIGTRLCERLLAEGKDVIPVDRVPNKWNKDVDARTKKIDLLDEKSMDGLPEDIDILIHLAANARVYDLVEEPALARENMATVFNALDYVRRKKIPRFIFASSRETYGNDAHDLYTEDLVRVENCESPYTASKIAGEAMTHAYRRCYDLDAIIFRFSNVYGMYDDSNRVVPLFIRRARAGQPLTVFGEDKCLDFTYIDDAVDGIIKGIQQFDVAKNETYNIAYGEGVTLVHLAERITELLGSSSTIELGKIRTGEIMRYVADTSKAREKLGFDPRTPFDTGIEKAVKWYRSNG